MQFEEKFSGVKTPSLRVLLKRKAIIKDLVSDRAWGEPLDGEIIAEWAGQIAARLNAPLAVDALCHFLYSHIDTELSGDALDKLAWKIAANWDKFAIGECVPASPHQIDSEWCACKVVRVSLSDREFRGERRWQIVLYALSGPAVTEKVEVLWSSRFIAYIAQFLGFTKPWGRYPFSHPRELYGMLLLACLSWKGNALQCMRFTVPQLYARENRKLIKMRARVDFRCPLNLEIPCFRCTMGEDRCPAAIRELTVTMVKCSACGRKCLTSSSGPVICRRCAKEG
jgi:hypothetical protein